MKPIALIVANAKGCLKENRKEELDSYDTVIRLNRFAIDGYEDHIGTKCDYWVLAQNLVYHTSYYKSNKDRINKMFPDLKILCLPANPWDKKAETTGNYTMVDTDSLIKETDKLHLEVLGKQKGYKQSTGMLTILYFKKLFHLHLYNFDFGQSNHYYGNKWNDVANPAHQWEEEKALFKHFEKNGELTFI